MNNIAAFLFGLVVAALSASPAAAGAQPVVADCVGDACNSAELVIHEDGCVYLTNRSQWHVVLSNYLTVEPHMTVRVDSRVLSECIGNFHGQYQLRYLDLVS